MFLFANFKMTGKQLAFSMRALSRKYKVSYNTLYKYADQLQLPPKLKIRLVVDVYDTSISQVSPQRKCDARNT